MCFVKYKLFVCEIFNVFKSRRSYRSLLAPIHNREPGTPEGPFQHEKARRMQKKVRKTIKREGNGQRLTPSLTHCEDPNRY